MFRKIRSHICHSPLALSLVLFCCMAAWGAEVDRSTLELKLGGAELVTPSHPVKRVTIAAPDIADVFVLSPREIYVYGKKVGYTSIMLWEEGKGRTILDLVVALDLTALKEKMHLLFPAEQIRIHGSETGVVLSGSVSGPEIVEQALRLTQAYLPVVAENQDTQEGSGKSLPGITNLLRVEGVQQVMLEVRVAEITRRSEKDWQAALGLSDLGSSFGGNFGVGNLGNLTNGGLASPTGSMLVNFSSFDGITSAANIFARIDDVTTALKFLETEGLARILAEPRLVTLSGQEAKFLAGGEFPIPVAQDLNTITIEFKEFGVALVFTPVVMSNGKISLRVAPTVSEISSTSAFPAGILGAEFIIPNLSTRKLETTVQLYDGQTLALAGLLQDNLREEVKKIPGLGDIPVLGALFKSTSYLQEKTDLMIAVTPHLVQPVAAGSLEFPGEHFQPPTWYEFYLEGRLEGRRPSQQGEPQPGEPVKSEQTGGLEGTFGYQPASVRE